MLTRLFKISSVTLVLSLLVGISYGIYIKYVSAAAITSASDVMTRLDDSTVTADHTITFTLPAGVDFDSGDELRIDFPHSSAFTQGGTWAVADFTVSDGSSTDVNAVEATGSPNGAVAGCSDDNNNVGIEIDTTNLVFSIIPCGGSYTASATGATIIFTIDGTTADGTLTNPTSAGAYTITIANDENNDGSDNDTTSIVVRIVTNDQVTVTATVDPTFTFSLGSSSVSLGTLGTGTTGTGTHTVSASTNGSGGFSITYNGALLTSGSNDIDSIGTAQASSQGTEQFGINLKDNATPNIGSNPTTNAGTCGIAANYGTADSFSYAASATTTVTNVSAPADCVYTVSYIANISSITPAGAYSTTLTWIGTATF